MACQTRFRGKIPERPWLIEAQTAQQLIIYSPHTHVQLFTFLLFKATQLQSTKGGPARLTLKPSTTWTLSSFSAPERDNVAENNTRQWISHQKLKKKNLDILHWLISSNGSHSLFFFLFSSISSWADTVCCAAGMRAKLLASIWVTDVAQTCVCRRWKSTVTGWNNDYADYSLELQVSQSRRRQRRLLRRRAS